MTGATNSCRGRAQAPSQTVPHFQRLEKVDLPHRVGWVDPEVRQDIPCRSAVGPGGAIEP
jgi:hypothetical protein